MPPTPGTFCGCAADAPCHLLVAPDQVVLNAGVAWGPHERAPDAMFHLLGMVPAGGTLGQYLVAQAAQLYHAPSHLTGPQAAALPLAGLTAYAYTRRACQSYFSPH